MSDGSGPFQGRSAGIDPEPAGLGAAPAWIEHRDRGVVGEQLLRSEDVLRKSFLRRRQPPAGAAEPVGEGRAIDLDGPAGQRSGFAGRAAGIAVFRDHDMGGQGGGREVLGDRPLRGRRLLDGPAGLATIARSADTDDPEACRPRRGGCMYGLGAAPGEAQIRSQDAPPVLPTARSKAPLIRLGYPDYGGLRGEGSIPVALPPPASFRRLFSV